MEALFVHGQNGNMIRQQHIVQFILILAVFFACTADNDDPIPTDNSADTNKVTVIDDYSGCVHLSIPAADTTPISFSIVNQYGYELIDTVLTTSQLIVPVRLEPSTPYFYKGSGAVEYEGKFTTASITLLLNGVHHMYVTQKLSLRGEEPKMTDHGLRDVEIIAINENQLFIIWNDRQTRLVDHDYHSCESIGFKAPQNSDINTAVFYSINRDSIFIHDVNIENSGYSNIYNLRGTIQR